MQRISAKFVQSIYDESPIPVYEYMMNRYFGVYNSSYTYTGKRRYPHIVISTDLHNYQKISVFFHELGHHLCEKKQCYCSKSDELKEVHALVFELSKCLELELMKSLIWTMCTILYTEEYDGWDDLNFRAVKRLMKRKVWKKCTEIALADPDLFFEERKKHERRSY